MDLSKTYPRSPRTKLADLVMLARTTDKARSHNAGTAGPYHYGCGMDRHVLGFLGSNPDEFALIVDRQGEDSKIEAWARDHLTGKSTQEIEEFNRGFAIDGPAPGSDAEKFFRAEQQRLGRSDISSWFDLLDLDEGREVPNRIAA